MKTIKTNLIVLLIPTLFLFVGCDSSTEPAPTSGTISGAVTFTGTWLTTGTVSISMQTSWPPGGAPYASKTIELTDLNSDVYSYNFENIAFGTYPAIVVSWQDPNDTNPATNQHTLGAYGGVHPFFTNYGGTDPTEVTISAENNEQLHLDFNAEWGLAVNQ